jgi:hypothetical protein
MMAIKGLPGRAYDKIKETDEILYEYITTDGSLLQEVVQPFPVVLMDELFLCLRDNEGKLVHRWSGSDAAKEMTGNLM